MANAAQYDLNLVFQPGMRSRRSRHILPGTGAAALDVHFVGSRSWDRQKRGGSGSERDVKLSKSIQRERK